KKVSRAIYDRTIDLPKGWALLENTRFGKKGGRKKIKPKVVSILKQLFLNGNLNPKDKLTAKKMHKELLKEFNQKETVIELETFKATSSSSNGKD
ncbi:20079_t:CDS:2, partial [Gigaspora margarita]